MTLALGRVENAGNQHFLLFPQCFQKAAFSRSLKPGLCGKELIVLSANSNPLPSLCQHHVCKHHFHLSPKRMVSLGGFAPEPEEVEVNSHTYATPREVIFTLDDICQK